MNFITVKKVLVLILLFAAILRFVGLYPGFPNYHSDENFLYSSAVTMIKENNLKPIHYVYPALTPLIHVYLYKTVFIPVNETLYIIKHLKPIIKGTEEWPLQEKNYKSFYQTNIIGSRDVNAMYWSRYITALFSIGVVLLTYLVGRKLFNERVGLVTAFLVTINYRQVLNSHFALPDIYNAFFLLLAFWGTLQLLEKQTLKRLSLVGLFVGLSLATKYQFFSVFPVVLILLINLSKKP